MPVVATRPVPVLAAKIRSRCSAKLRMSWWLDFCRTLVKPVCDPVVRMAPGERCADALLIEGKKNRILLHNRSVGVSPPCNYRTSGNLLAVHK